MFGRVTTVAMTTLHVAVAIVTVINVLIDSREFDLQLRFVRTEREGERGGGGGGGRERGVH